MPLSVGVEAGYPFSAVAWVNVVMTVSPVIWAWALMWSRKREWSSSQEKIWVSVPSASGQWVKSDCQVSFGTSAWKRRQEERGRFWGWGLTWPWLLRIRQIVDTEGLSGPGRRS